ncbi:SH3 domain-containing protein [Chloroflexus sp.]|uniref:SH3 domain-containing protein n=1 Tax=Chloroflexus sp. TaxID=1904827 RepID=UPI002ACD88F6|nr:SH3 domain-containing protein [Chloroflexus sp.]
MPTTSEMYERGAADAERGEFNPFYYQHYYYYRQGFDSVRRRHRSRFPLAGLFMLITVIALGITVTAWLIGQRGSPAVAQPVASPVAAIASATPTSLPPSPAPLPSPTPLLSPTPPTLQVGGKAVVVNVGNAPLRLRAAPGLQARVVGSLPGGREVVLREGPVLADGYTWWQVEVGNQRGWCAVIAPDGTQFLEPVGQ